MNAVQATLVRTIGSFLVLLAAINDDFRVFTAGIGFGHVWIRMLGLTEMDAATRDHVEWALHCHTGSLRAPFRYACMGDKYPCAAKGVTPPLSNPALESAGLPDAVRHQNNPLDEKAAAIGYLDTPLKAFILETDFSSSAVTSTDICRTDQDPRFILAAADETPPVSAAGKKRFLL
jgi:hypothetical protein